MPVEEVESLLTEMILDKRLSAMIDQVNGCVLLDRSVISVEDKEFQQIEKMANTLAGLANSLCTHQN